MRLAKAAIERIRDGLNKYLDESEKGKYKEFMTHYEFEVNELITEIHSLAKKYENLAEQKDPMIRIPDDVRRETNNCYTNLCKVYGTASFLKDYREEDEETKGRTEKIFEVHNHATKPITPEISSFRSDSLSP